MTSFTNFNGEQIGFEYDLASHLHKKTLPDGRTVIFGYTPTGQRQTIADSLRGITGFTYDSRDRLLSRTEPNGAAVSYTWDENGNRKSVTAPSGVVSYAFDELDRLATVAAAGGTTTYTYDKVGNRKRCTTPNGVEANYGYDEQNRLVSLSHTKGVAVVASYSYTLGPTGNRIGISEHTGRQLVWTYDRTYRLTSESVFLPGQTNPLFFGWKYDRAGNRKKQTMTPPTGASEITTYSYNDNDQLLTEAKVHGVVTETTTYAYDLNGSTISKIGPSGSTSFTWSAERRLKTATVTPATGQVVNLAFVYDEDGIRVERVRNGDQTKFLIDQAQSYQQVLEERDASGALKVSYTYGDDLISQSRAGTDRFYVSDGQLSTRALTDAAGAVSDTYDYAAFGVLLASTGNTENAYRYTGEQEDADVGGYYLRARYYAPGSGRFVSEDFHDRGGSRSYHKYSYTAQNPVNYYDRSGTEFTTLQKIGVLVLIAVVVAALLTIVVRAIFGGWERLKRAAFGSAKFTLPPARPSRLIAIHAKGGTFLREDVREALLKIYKEVHSGIKFKWIDGGAPSTDLGWRNEGGEDVFHVELADDETDDRLAGSTDHRHSKINAGKFAGISGDFATAVANNAAHELWHNVMGHVKFDIFGNTEPYSRNDNLPADALENPDLGEHLRTGPGHFRTQTERGLIIQELALEGR